MVKGEQILWINNNKQQNQNRQWKKMSLASFYQAFSDKNFMTAQRN